MAEEQPHDFYRQEIEKKSLIELWQEGQAREKTKSLSGLDVRVSDKSELPAVRQDEKIEIHTGNLSLSEMLALAEKVENWEMDHEVKYGRLFGSIQGVSIEIDVSIGFFHLDYLIQAKCNLSSNQISLGKYQYKRKSSFGKEIKQIYGKVYTRIKEYEHEHRRIVLENEKRDREKVINNSRIAREDALRLAKSLI